jgi:hypothetical protein
VVLLLLLGCVGCDQATKRLALALLPEGRRVTLLGDVVRLELSRNSGGFLGAGGGHRSAPGVREPQARACAFGRAPVATDLPVLIADQREIPTIHGQVPDAEPVVPG